MAKEVKQNTLDNIEHFASSIGSVLVRVKDTIVQDLLKDILEEGMSWEEYKCQLKETDPSGQINLLHEFVDRIIKKLGYDLTNSNTTKIYDLFSNLVSTTINLQQTIVKLVDNGINLTEFINENGFDVDSLGSVCNDIFANNKAEEYSINIGNENASAQITIGGIDKVMELVDMVKTIVSTIKEISEFEWNSIVEDAEDFKDFITSTYFTKQFGKRVLDYILIQLLKNAKDVFSDDIHNLIASLKDKGTDEIKKFYKEGFTDYNSLNKLQNDIDQLKKEIEEAKEDARLKAIEYHVMVEPEAPIYLQTKLDIAEAKFEELSQEYLVVYNKTAKVFKQIYAILDLMGLIQTKRINLMKYVPEQVSKNISVNIEPIEIQCLRWDMFTTIFTKPLDYLKSVFHVTSVRDAEKLIGKIKTVIQAFKEDNIETGSTKNLLYSLAIKTENQENTNDGIKDIVSSLLNMQEAINYKFDEFIFKEFKSFKEGGACIFDIFNYDVLNAFEKISYDDNGKYTNDITGIEFTDYSAGKEEQVTKTIGLAVDNTLISIVEKNLCDYIVSNTGKSVDEIESCISESIKNSDVYKHLCTMLSAEDRNVTNHIVGCWEDCYREVISDVSDFLEYDLRELPTMVNGEDHFEFDLKKGLEEFSNFDIDAYFEGISERFDNQMSFDLNGDYDEFKESLGKTIDKLTFENIDKNEILEEVLSTSWNEIVSATKDLVVQPYKQTIDLALNEVKQYFYKSIHVEFPQDRLSSLLKNVDTNLVESFFKLDPESGIENSWNDGLTFATNLSKLLPESVKLPNGYVKFPDIKLKLPKYTIDTKNKMLSAELCNFKKDDNFFTLQLVAFVTNRIPNGKDKEKTGIFIMPVLKGSAGYVFDIGSSHQLAIGAGIEANGGSSTTTEDKTGLFFYTGDKFYDIHVEPVSDKDSVSLDAEITFSRQVGNTFNIFSTDLVELSIDNYPLSLFLGYNREKDGEVTEGFDFGVQGSIENFRLLLKLKEVNDFFKAILKDNIEINLEELSLGYTLKKGFNIGGSFFVNIPLNAEIEYKGIKFSNLSVELGCKNGDLVARANTSFSATLSGCSVGFSNFGVGCTCNLLDGSGNLGSFEVSPEFKYPTGLAIAIDTTCVKGAGAIEYDKENGKFSGYGSLEIMEKIGVTALFMLTTDPFSFMGLLSATFTPGIPLGMGFSLTGVGGCLGLNRSLDVNKMREAVYQGTLINVFFVESVSDNISEMLATTEQMFPVKKKQFFVGLLAQISYAPVVKCDLGLLFEFPSPTRTVLVGGLHVTAGDTDKLIAINVNFMGTFDMATGITIDASLYDSHIVGLELSGAIAFRLLWGGNTKGFLLSIGGFHPAYIPEAGMMVPEMNRLSIALNYDIVKIKLETYLAVTSNSFQIGAHLDFKVGWKEFGITGYAGFDSLIQFDPFLFMFNLEMGVTVKSGSWKLISVDLKLDVQGPAPWKVSGSAKFTFILIPIKVNFSLKWGKNSQSLPSEEILILKELQKAFDNNYNWLIENRETENGIILKEQPFNKDEECKQLFLQPFSILDFNQSQIPFVTNKGKGNDEELKSMDICNNARPVDYNALEVVDVKLGETKYSGSSISIQKNDFAPALYKNMSVHDKISSPSYVKYNSGFTVSPILEDKIKSVDLISKAKHILKDIKMENPKEISYKANNRMYARKDKSSFSRYITSLDKVTSSQKEK